MHCGPVVVGTSTLHRNALGLAAVVFRLLWWNGRHLDNENFLPVFIGYVGGGLLLSGILNLTYTLRHRNSENSTPS